MSGDDLLEQLVDVLALGHPEIRSRAPRLASGTFNDVVVLDGEWVARFPRNTTVLTEAPRRTAGLRRLSGLDLPFAVPLVLDEQLDRPLGEAHVVISYVSGDPAPTTLSEDAAVVVIHELLDPLADARPDPDLVAVLDEPLRFAGGADVVAVITEHVFPILSEDERTQATGVLARFEALEPVAPRLVHGGLAPVNLRWRGARVTRLLDWDFAHVGDPALDAAALANFGWSALKRAVDAETYERARTHAALFPLEGAAGTLLQGASPERYLAWFRRRCALREHPPGS